MPRNFSVVLVLLLVFALFSGCAPAPTAEPLQTQAATEQTKPAATEQTEPAPEDNPYLRYYDPETEHILTYSGEDEVEHYFLLGMDAHELRLAKNEIYARHGYCFSDPALLAYFNLCSWYQPAPGKTSAEDLPLTPQEQNAVALIVEYEKNPGYDTADLDTRLTEQTEFIAFSVQLPAYWKDCCTIDRWENGISFSQSMNYEKYGGHLFSISLHETKEEVEYFPAYEIIGTVTHENGTQYYVVVTEPTDVQFDFGDLSMGQYRYMAKESRRILATIEGTNGYTYTPL